MRDMIHVLDAHMHVNQYKWKIESSKIQKILIQQILYLLFTNEC